MTFFRNIGIATSASQGILNSLLLASTTPDFNSAPHLILGCEDLSLCGIFTPYSINSGLDTIEAVAAVILANSPNVVDDAAQLLGTPANTVNTTNFPKTTWAVWKNSRFEQPIPEPSTLLLFGSGIAGLIGWRLRKQKTV